MTRTTVAILSLFCSSALAAAAPQTAGESRIFKPSQTAVRPGAPLPPVRSIKTLFGGTAVKDTKPGDLQAHPLNKTHTIGGRPQSFLSCGTTIFLADPNVDGKSLKKHSSEGFPIRRIEPQTCK